MAERLIFLDTSGIFAWINARDPFHDRMLALPRQDGVRFIMTDYIVDEACALFAARNIAHRREDLFQPAQKSRIVRLEWVGKDTFWQAWEWLRKFRDQPFSLTDCTCFATMENLHITEAATTDSHFQIAGFRPLLVQT